MCALCMCVRCIFSYLFLQCSSFWGWRGGAGDGGGGGSGGGGIGGERGISWDDPLLTDSTIFVFVEKA